MLQSTNKYNTVTEWLHTSKWHFTRRGDLETTGFHWLIHPAQGGGLHYLSGIWAHHPSFRQPMSALIPTLFTGSVFMSGLHTTDCRWERGALPCNVASERGTVTLPRARGKRGEPSSSVCSYRVSFFCRYYIIYIQSWLASTEDTLMSRLIAIDIWYLFFTCKYFRRRNHGKYASVWCSYDLRKTTVRRTFVNNSVWTFTSNTASFFLFFYCVCALLNALSVVVIEQYIYAKHNCISCSLITFFLKL